LIEGESSVVSSGTMVDHRVVALGWMVCLGVVALRVWQSKSRVVAPSTCELVGQWVVALGWDMCPAGCSFTGSVNGKPRLVALALVRCVPYGL
jgi:hypothetical protein